jgi:hypothetical protein
MAEYNFDAIKLALPKLTAAERTEIIERCKAFGSLSKSGKVQVERSELDPHDWLASAIGSVLIARGQATPQNYWFLMQRAMPHHYVENSLAMRTWLLNAASLKKPTHIQTAKLGKTAIGALVTYLTSIPTFNGVGPKVLMNNINSIPQALDAELPGYVENGLFRIVVQT